MRTPSAPRIETALVGLLPSNRQRVARARYSHVPIAIAIGAQVLHRRWHPSGGARSFPPPLAMSSSLFCSFFHFSSCVFHSLFLFFFPSCSSLLVVFSAARVMATKRETRAAFALSSSFVEHSRFISAVRAFAPIFASDALDTNKEDERGPSPSRGRGAKFQY